MNILAMIQILDALLMLAEKYPVLQARYQALRDGLTDMAAEGRDPTDEEWAAFDAKTDTRLARLREKFPKG